MQKRKPTNFSNVKGRLVEVLGNLTVMDIHEHCKALYSQVDAGEMLNYGVPISFQWKIRKVGFENCLFRKQMTAQTAKQR